MAYVRQHPDYPKFRKKVGTMPDFSGSNFADQETPIGVIDGVNKVFTLAFIPMNQSEEIFKDGMKMKRASSTAFTDGDYVINYSTGIITFADTQVPQTNTVLHVSYKFLRS